MLKSMAFRSTLAAVLCTLSFGAHAMADSPKKVEIAAGDLRPALLQLSKAYGVELLYQPSQLDHFRTAGVKGSYTPEAAVRLLLKGTLLELHKDPSGAMMVIDPKAPHAATINALSEQAALSQSTENNSQPGSRLQLAQANVGQAAAAVSVDSKAETSSQQPVIQEVIVTAQKREERLQDVPVPVSVLNAQSLTENNQVRLQDYYTQIPGLSIGPGGASSQTLAIRGLTTGNGNPTVGLMIDEVPFGSATANNFVTPVPDFDPGDLARVEVLRGPQGTLYGASSMGGLIKFVTVNPSTDIVSGRVEAGTEEIEHGANLGYNLRGSVNLPLDDDFALRASGFYREDPGYLDNPVLGIEDINRHESFGGRLAALWRPTDSLSVKVSALYQRLNSDGEDDSTPGPGLGDLQQDYIRGVGAYEREAQAYSVVVDDKIGKVDLTSITGWNVSSFHDSEDFSSVFGGTFQGLYGVSGAPSFNAMSTSKFSQELHATVPIGNALDWLVGVYYTHEATSVAQALNATNPTTGAFATQFLYSPWYERYAEQAAFTDLTFHATDRFDIQVGGRVSHIEQSYVYYQYGPYCPVFLLVASPCNAPKEWSTGNPFTYLITPSFKLSGDFLLYARAASGYRPGGPNEVFPGIPSQYGPDKTQDYEIGAKKTLLDGTLTLDASVYYIDWKDIQVQLLTDGQLYTGNAGGAKSQGLEISAAWKPVAGLKLAGWVAWNDAELTKAFPPDALAAGTYAYEGERLPYSAPFTSNVSVDDEFPVTGTIFGAVGVDASYTARRWWGFQAAPEDPRVEMPDYYRVDVHVGLQVAAWSANLFINNLTDRRGVLSNGPSEFTFPPYSTFFVQPRTIGLNIVRKF